MPRGKRISVAQLQQLAIDYGIKRMNLEELSQKYGWNKKKVSNILATARKQGLLPRVRKSRGVTSPLTQSDLFQPDETSPVPPPPEVTLGTPMPSIPVVQQSGYRKITFPGGLTVHVSKKSQAKLYVNEDGDIDLVTN